MYSESNKKPINIIKTQMISEGPNDKGRFKGKEIFATIGCTVMEVWCVFIGLDFVSNRIRTRRQSSTKKTDFHPSLNQKQEAAG